MMMLHRCLMLALVMMGLLLQACAFAAAPLMYSAEAIEAWVVDEDTGQPLEGVIVVANWELIGGLHPDTVGQLMVMETVTDANGRFSFPAWGPKLRPPGGYLDNHDPALMLFKSGYTSRELFNELTEKVSTDSLRRSVWHGQTIKLKKFEGSLQKYARHLISLTISLGFADHGKDCEWQQIPRMLVALDRQGKLFDEKGVSNNLFSIDRLPNQTQCGSAREFLRSYLP